MHEEVKWGASSLEAWSLALRCSLAYLSLLTAGLRVELALKAGFDPSEPRDDHGRWTDTGTATSSERRTTLAQADGTTDRYSVVLTEEEARGGHAIRVHVGKSDEELIATLRAMRIDTPLVTVAAPAQGSFDSLEQANDLVNRILEVHSSTVNLVATGALDKAWLPLRFGFPTGREAFRPDADAEPYVRKTYDVGVLIEHDPRAKRGYTVITAYPRNERPE